MSEERLILMTEQEMEAYREKARLRIPVKYRQPISEYIGRSVNGSEEDVDYVPGTHLRIWYNNLMEGYDVHHHSATEIIVCVENGYSVFIDDHLYTMEPGDVFFIPPNVLHRLPGGVEGARFICLMDLAPLHCFRDFKVLEPVIMRHLHLSKAKSPTLYHKVYELMMKIIDTYFSSKSMWELAIYASLLEIYTAIGQEYYSDKERFSATQSTVHRSNYEKFASLLTYIDENYSENITLEQAADKVGFSKYHFARLFKEYTGTTFLDHLMHKRVQAAQKLLSTDLSVTDIAFSTGFNSLTSFNRSFHKYTGLSPTQFRALRENYHGHKYLFTEPDSRSAS